MDSGAGVSVMDHKTVMYVGLDKQIRRRGGRDQPLINASGKEMDILGVVDVPIALGNGEIVHQEFSVLNSNHGIILRWVEII